MTRLNERLAARRGLVLHRKRKGLMSPETEREPLQLLKVIRTNLDTGSVHLRAILASCDRIAAHMARTGASLDRVGAGLERVADHLERAP